MHMQYVRCVSAEREWEVKGGGGVGGGVNNSKFNIWLHSVGAVYIKTDSFV